MAAWTQLKSEHDYTAAVERVSVLMDIERSDDLHNEFMLLSYLIEEYDEEHYPMPDASPQEVIQFMLEMRDLKQEDLIPILGSEENVSKILSSSGSLPPESINALSVYLKIPKEALIPKI